MLVQDIIFSTCFFKLSFASQDVLITCNISDETEGWWRPLCFKHLIEKLLSISTYKNHDCVHCYVFVCCACVCVWGGCAWVCGGGGGGVGVCMYVYVWGLWGCGCVWKIRSSSASDSYAFPKKIWTKNFAQRHGNEKTKQNKTKQKTKKQKTNKTHTHTHTHTHNLDRAIATSYSLVKVKIQTVNSLYLWQFSSSIFVLWDHLHLQWTSDLFFPFFN